jgi:hypothetical protein
MHIARLDRRQFRLNFVVICMLLGLIFLVNFRVRYALASAQSNIIKDTDTDFSQGSLSSTQIVGSGSGAYINLTGGSNWWNNNYTYRRQLTIDITGNSSLPAGYSLLTSITGSDASSIYNSSLSSGNDFRIVYWDGSTYTELTRDLLTFSDSSIQFYFKTQAQLNSSDTSHYFIYYRYSSASAPTVDKTLVYNNTYNAASVSNGGTATASDSYASNPIIQVNNDITGGGAGSVGWGNNNVAGSRSNFPLPLRFGKLYKDGTEITPEDGANQRAHISLPVTKFK